MANVIPLLVAFVGALFGTYFALLKSRRECLWLDRYETLLRIVSTAEIVRSRFMMQQADHLQLHEFTAEEIAAMETSWKSARADLRTDVTRVRMLFDATDARSVVDAHQDLDRAILEALAPTQRDPNLVFNSVWLRTNDLIDKVIALARKRCR
ncbi:hypothetical protein HNQ60_005147 [Povalibacter uvarum]|uniref:Uncharacterized protein n=1 Tax=Povalibacter uvarum TaxID=732238 RepID=A0A841HWR7_9GAMM|nr:hypothetical protein [Povalibacter uvarum]MBB6096225.1 hypothetical protein [Povalibacter uvarum]